jgi:hypothetical protein
MAEQYPGRDTDPIWKEVDKRRRERITYAPAPAQDTPYEDPDDEERPVK